MNLNRSSPAEPGHQEKTVGCLLARHDRPGTFRFLGPGRLPDKHGLPRALRSIGPRGLLRRRGGRIRRSPTGSALSPGVSGRSRGVAHFASAAVLISLCLITALGCSSDKRQVEDIAMQWVDGIKSGNVETLERIIDWELWYSVHSKGAAPGEGSARTGSPSTSGQSDERQADLEYQKSLLLGVLSTDRVIALQYLTAVNKIKTISIKGDQAIAEISQEDRTSGERRRVILQMHKDPEVGWRVYKFRKEDLEEV